MSQPFESVAWSLLLLLFVFLFKPECLPPGQKKKTLTNAGLPHWVALHDWPRWCCASCMAAP